jgi:hypothetical protein
LIRRCHAASWWAGILGLLYCTAAGAGVLATLEDTVASWYPGADLERTTHYPTREQLDQARGRAGVDIPEAPVYRYRATRDQVLLADIYLDRHRVRTLPATVAVAVEGNGTVGGIAVLAFHEPREYLPRPKWYQQFQGRTLEPELQMHRGIDGITGATLSARSAIDAVRRVLALHEAFAGEE